MVIDVNLDPTQGSEMSKVRPCVIVTNDVYNERVPVIQVVPITGWTEKKGRIKTNVVLLPSATNGLSKQSVADCLQTRPIDHRLRLVRVRGVLAKPDLDQIDQALRIVFALTQIGDRS
ncbi:MAG: type II toxin-antitoxin system PemK/MazF family toxin [Chloroflexi bacterium]|nr:MAG: type II toxin-antitoxin system PemK/MazF family toxin [Chloroflexota bacterium]